MIRVNERKERDYGRKSERKAINKESMRNSKEKKKKEEKKRI